MSIKPLHRELSLALSLPRNFGKAKSMKEANEHALALGIKAKFNIAVEQANIVNESCFTILKEYGVSVNVIGTSKMVLIDLAKKVLERDNGFYNGEDVYEVIRDRRIIHGASNLRTIARSNKSFIDKCAEYCVAKYEIVPRIPKHNIASHLHFPHQNMIVNGMNFNKELMKKYSEDSMHESTGFSAFVGVLSGGDYVRKTTMHEMGHHLDHLLNDSIEWNYFKNNYYDKNIEEIETGLSRYATTDEMEMVAEAFAEYKTSHSPRKISIEIGTMLDKHIKELDL